MWQVAQVIVNPDGGSSWRMNGVLRWLCIIFLTPSAGTQLVSSNPEGIPPNQSPRWIQDQDSAPWRPCLICGV
ncbi:hypothetical protein L210DRAFT_3543594 [Boletus edulis BED1]|uniref:Uncharacterized protein n=1 Tax=Boletus edulis BED1 TaxID=1328754 RepID=A0AAD4BSJ1_BOLED|nr:hypothetical protein L210DRAFT_3564482 [Boletus edulis BED1]KAF8438333.1 hypothetical protein L210DRAFT_3543594 [Boletus edulis BED1]